MAPCGDPAAPAPPRSVTGGIATARRRRPGRPAPRWRRQTMPHWLRLRRRWRKWPPELPLGICTIDSSESMPFSALLMTGTPSTGNTGLGGGHARQVGRAAGAGDDGHQAAGFGRGGVFEQQVRGAMGRDHAHFVRHTQLIQQVCGRLEGLPVGSGAHDEADPWFHLRSLARAFWASIWASSAASMAGTSSLRISLPMYWNCRASAPRLVRRRASAIASRRVSLSGSCGAFLFAHRDQVLPQLLHRKRGPFA